MAAPVVVSRIQNRRGTQDQFEALYPDEYISAPTASSSGVTITVASTAGVYQYAKPFVQAGTGQFAPGTQVVAVISATQFTVNLPPVVPLSGATIKISKYNGTGGCPISEYPNILMSGELALCTDSRRMYMGNINGEYVEISPAFNDGIFLSPLSITLPPALTYTVIPQLTYQATPFFNLLYDITDVTSPDWNVVGTSYSRNGTMKITATADFVPIPNPPFPPITSVSLVDDGVEINLSAPDNISFTAAYNAANIEISYKHNFPGSLTLSSSTIRWLPF